MVDALANEVLNDGGLPYGAVPQDYDLIDDVLLNAERVLSSRGHLLPVVLLVRKSEGWFGEWFIKTVFTNK